eukprot:TRINITY_DN7366_c0_g1_i1.p1 TRINITY_DN7366_c0_g1~~TRINITY_DN7366_c0_g1_i1.p1  ORF type:complete len:408 (-),score=41.76 TRINITY_DN7366_c0_g1_i1:762-1985(-)
MPITRLRGEFFFLSNFFPCRSSVQFESDLYPTSEHAYQAAKLEDATLREPFTVDGSLAQASPLDAKRKGGKLKVRGGWDSMKVKVMEEIVRSKFQRDVSLAAKLLATGAQKIVEGHTGDKFWGGKANHLGNILMKVRSELRVMGYKEASAGTIAHGSDSSTGDDEATCCVVKQQQKNVKAGRLEVMVVSKAGGWPEERFYWVERDAIFGTIVHKCAVDFELEAIDASSTEHFIFSVEHPASRQFQTIGAQTVLKDFAAEDNRVVITFTAVRTGEDTDGADDTAGSSEALEDRPPAAVCYDITNAPQEIGSMGPDSCFAQRRDDCSLPPLFAAWLFASLESELNDNDSAQSLLIGAEVILGGEATNDCLESDGASEAIANVCDLLVAEGAPETAAAVEAQWARRWVED